MIADIGTLDVVGWRCRRMVKNRALAAAAAGFVPIPAADVATDIGLLSDLLPRISAVVELDHDSVRKLEPPIAENLSKLELGANAPT